MEILLKRLATYKQCLHGRLYIEGDHVCDTLEQVGDCLAPGLHRIIQLGGKRVCRKENVASFYAANGPYALPRGGVAVGEWKYLGFLIHCADYYEPLVERLRMARNRGKWLMLRIEDAVTVEA